MSDCAYIIAADGAAEPVARDAAERACGKARFVWIHVDAREAANRAWIERADMPHAAILALTATETRPRVDLIHGGAILNLRGLAVAEDEAPDGLVSIRIWATKGRVYSAGYSRISALATVREEVEAGRIRDPGDLITAVAVAITLALDPQVAALGDTLDDCESDIGPQNALTMRGVIARTRRQAIFYRRFVAPQREALDRLAGLEVDWLEEDDRIHIRGAADRFARMAEELESVRERSALMHEQLTDLRSELIERRALALSIVALIFLPLTFITGLFGMNVDGIPYQHHPASFWVITGFCVAVAVIVAGWFAVARWFRT